MELVSVHRNPARKFRAFLHALRPVNLLILAGSEVLISILFSVLGSFNGWAIHPGMLVLAVLSSLSIAAAGNLHNDIHDIRSDSINRPGSNPAETFSLRMLSAWRNILGIAGLFGGVIAGIITGSWYVIIVFILSVILLWAYSPYLKSRVFIGNLAVSLLPALAIFIIPAIWIESGTGQFRPEILFFVIFAFLTSLCREIIKDIEDIEGDRQGGYRTMPVVYGIKRTRTVAGILAIVLNIAIILLAINLYQQGLYLSASFMIIPAILTMLWDFHNRGAMSKEIAGKQSRRMKYIMAVGLAGMLVLILENIV